MVLDEATETASPLFAIAGTKAGKAPIALESLLERASDEDCPSEDPGGVNPVEWDGMAPTVVRARGKILPSSCPLGTSQRKVPLLRLNQDGRDVPDDLAKEISPLKALLTALTSIPTLSLAFLKGEGLLKGWGKKL